jgi:single-stranded DNA-binding protein
MTYYDNTQAPQKPQYQTKETSSFGGIVTQAPKQFDTSNGYGVSVNIVANYKTKTGDIEPYYVELTLFGSQADFARDFLEVGDGVTGVGEKQIRTYKDQQGVEKQSVRITVKSLNIPINKVADLIVRIVDSRVAKQPETQPVVEENATPQPQPQAPTQPTGFTQPAPAYKPQEEIPTLQIDSDDLPF